MPGDRLAAGRRCPSDPHVGGRPGRPVACGMLTPTTRDRLVRLLAVELMAAWNAALAVGATPDELVNIVVNRRRAIVD